MTFETINGFDYMIDEKNGDLIGLANALSQIFEKPLSGQIHKNIFIHNRDQLFLDSTKNAYVRLDEFLSIVEPRVPQGELKRFKKFLSENEAKMFHPRKFLAPKFRVEAERDAGILMARLDKLQVVSVSDEEKQEIQELLERMVDFIDNKH